MEQTQAPNNSPNKPSSPPEEDISGAIEGVLADRRLRNRQNDIPPDEDISGAIAEVLGNRGLGSRPVNPTFPEQAQAAVEGLTRGIYEGGSFLAPIIAGGKGGTALMPFAGPFAPAMPFVGAFVGAGVGFFASDFVGSVFSRMGIEADERTTSIFEGFRTFGSSVAFAPGVMFLKAAPEGAGKIRKTIGAIGAYAQANKGTYYSTEALASMYAGIAGGAAVEYYPNSPLLRPVAEVTFSFAPTRWAPQLASTVVDAIKKGKQAVETPGFSDKTFDFVSDQLITMSENAGEDPKALVRAIDEFLAPSLDAVPTATVAQITGSPFFTKLQSTIARYNAKYSGDTREIGETALQAYGDITLRLENSGDPALLAASAYLRKSQIDMELQTGFNIAQTIATEKIMKLGARGSDNALVAGNILQNEMVNLLRIGRESETQLWQDAIRASFKQAGGKVEAVKTQPTRLAEALYEVSSSPFSSGSRGDVSNELNALNKDLAGLGFNKKKLKALNEIEVTPEYLETRQLDPEALFSLDLKSASVIDMVRFRSSLLEKARESAGTGKPAVARRYTVLANAILEDLDALPGAVYARPRAFSRGLNDAFTRTFAGKTSAVNSKGGELISPEVLVNRAFSAGADTTLQRMREMEAAADFVDPSGQAAISVRDAERKVVRAAASKALGLDGTINVRELDNFRTQNADTLKFLGMEDEFTDISRAERAFLEVNDPQSLLNKRIKDEEAFALLLNVEDPSVAVSMALTNTKQPVKNFKSLVETASSSPDPATREAARRGLVATIYQYAFQGANKSGVFTPQAFDDIFFKPLSPNNPSLANMMRSSDLMSGDELARLKQMSNKMVTVEKALQTQARIVDPDTVFQPKDAVENLVVTMLGAKFAGAIGPGGPGSLSFASKTINAFNKYFNATPARQKLLLLEEATKNPMLFKQLMTRNPSAAEARNTQVSMLRYLYSPAVLPTAIDRYVETSDPEPAQPSPRAAAMLRSMPPAVATRGTPNVKLPTAQGPAEQAQAQQPPGVAPQAPGSESREMLQRLFPNEMN